MRLHADHIGVDSHCPRGPCVCGVASVIPALSQAVLICLAINGRTTGQFRGIVRHDGFTLTVDQDAATLFARRFDGVGR